MSEGRIIGYLTYKEFAKKYGIRLTTSTTKRKKTMKELATQIYNYEKNTILLMDYIFKQDNQFVT